MSVIIEPFRIKMVEPIRFTTRVEREALLKDFGLDGAWNCEDAPPKVW